MQVDINSVLITAIGIVLNAGIIIGVLKTSTKNMEKQINSLEQTITGFGKRLGDSEGDIKSIKDVCAEKHEAITKFCNERHRN